MRKLRKIFGEINITWKGLIIFALLLGIGVGILNRIPILNNTSFQDIAIVLDMWIILAIFVIMNCKNWKEAVAKCFVFFLISQPLIYFTELIIGVLIYKANFKDLFILYFKNYYIGAGWLRWTLLTIPGAYIAYQVKKNNVLSALILSVATTYLSIQGTLGLIEIINGNFPYHLLNSLIDLSMAYILIFILLKGKKERIISCIITTLGIVSAFIILFYSNRKPMLINTIVDFEDGAEIIECVVEDENIARVELDNENHNMSVYSSKEVGTTKIRAIDTNKNEYIYIVNSTSKTFEVQK